MKPRGSLTATVITEGKTLPEGSANLENLHQENRRPILPSERVIFGGRGVFEKSNFSVVKMNLKRILGFS